MIRSRRSARARLSARSCRSARSRRAFVGGCAAIAVGSVGGCAELEVGGGEGDPNGAYATFFTLEEFTRGVAGDAMAVDNPIPPGAMGHHYEVGTSAQTDAVGSAAFVYLDVEGFQRWALEAAKNVGREDTGTVLVDALEGVDLLEFGGGDHAGDEHDHGHDGGNHDHGNVDPHFWTDPVRSQESVSTIAAGLAEADPDNAEVYQENAEDYRAELQELHETFETELADRELDTVVVAGHDSYQYLARRYGIDVHSPVGASPQAEPSQSAIADTVDLIDELGIGVVLYDAFESEGERPPPLARTIVEESTAGETAPLSAVEATTEEWLDRGWGYVEQMREVNLPALRRALGGA